METGDESALAEAMDALERMDAIVDDLFAMAREEHDPGTLEWVDLGPAVERTWGAVDPGPATLDVAVPEGTTVRAGSGQLRQLLENLFRNALEHGGPDVTVEVGIEDGGFYVEDDGPGIDADDPSDVFEFGVSEGSSGIGLVVVKEIAEAHDWTIDVAEGAAGGARFEIRECLLRTPAIESVREGEPVELSASVDVGGATPAGRHEHEPGEWVLEGAGRNVWRDVEECYFVHATLDGDARVVGRVAAVEPVHEYSKAGLMVRSGLDPGVPMAFVGLTPGHGSETLWRSASGGPIESESVAPDDEPPRWYRIDRVGETVTCYSSGDGERWTILDQHTVAASGPVSIGLATCSHDPDRRAEGRFEAVRVAPLEQDDTAGP